MIRRRLIQKMEYLAEALLPRHPPTDGELSALLTAHPERYALPRGSPCGRYSLAGSAIRLMQRLWPSGYERAFPWPTTDCGPCRDGSWGSASAGRTPSPPQRSRADAAFSAQLAKESFKRL